ncbi:VCBS repeat-containing protein [Winogradskyella alexanderae]|uniref:VCBS repeat-containing protein n=1 Tax=Winogradskyella alexanderae TaxID=2877123 RepID=A0ABS7XSZ3_9FLAO|nr:VCBS repeat-containing protein [Winogradskyella alexanderae]MCA0132052.1 VCBS repeat-containing protein [Winogradskyella alexanderae]
MKKIYLIALVCFLFLTCSEDSKSNPKKTSYLLESVSSDETGIKFKNLVTEDPQHSIINYIYYYNGSGVATGDINGDNLPDLFFVSNMGENKLYVNKGDFRFEDISETANIQGKSSWQTGVTMVDINNDGLLDIYVCAVSGLLDFTGHNELYINNGDGTFTENAKAYGLDFEGYSTQAYFFDYDKDNDLDVYIVNHAVHTTLSHGNADLRNKRMPLVGDVLLNNDNGSFKDVSESANIYGGVNGYGLSATIADFNNDGWDDIYVCNDFHEDDYYYINNQDGTFSEQLDKSFTTISRFSMGSDAADINGDGYQDLMTLDMLPKDERILKETEGDDAMFNMQEHLENLGYKDQYSRNMLQINNNGEYFHETALINKVADTDWSWAPLFADFNNDGHQDLFISNGILRRPNGLDFKKYVSNAFKGRSESEGLEWLFNSISEMTPGDVTNEMFEGNSKNFKSKTGEWIENKPSLSNGAVYVDLDLDGDLDIVTNNFNAVADVYRNTTNGTKNYINLELDYQSGNKDGIGTKAIVHANGKSQLKQLFKSRGFISSLDSKLYFGLNDAETIDSIEIIWPNNEYQKIYAPKINSELKVSYTPTNQFYVYDNLTNKNSYFKVDESISYVHEEDNYTDFQEEKLIPYKVSTFGPAFTKGDVDGNGYDDIYIGSASGKASQLYLNSGSSFSLSKQTVFEGDMVYEDNDATLFDADNDGDLDLYVASGITALKTETLMHDRLYLNQNGKFEIANNRIPVNNLITTVVKPYDYDNDGDTDLFIGNHSVAGDYGKKVTSYVLNNDGKGNFKKSTELDVSKVTSAIWKDINNDNVKDLIVACEWDAPRIYINNNGKLEPQVIPENINGLWQSVGTFDIDSDGDEDILLGNWGLNTKFNLYFDGPLHLYYSDFDKNGVNETLIAYNRDGKYYMVNSKDELAGQMNIINKIYVDHKSVAGKTIEEVMKQGTIDDAEKSFAHTLASGYLRNDNGQYTAFIPFEEALQLAPITTFTKISSGEKSELIIGGNSYKVNTYHGSYLSLKGLLLEDAQNYETVSQLGMAPFNDQIKQIEVVKMKDRNIVFVLANDAPLKLYSVTE